MKAYYDARAPEYDDWYLGRGLYADRDRPGWEDELQGLVGAIGSLPPARTLDDYKLALDSPRRFCPILCASQPRSLEPTVAADRSGHGAHVHELPLIVHDETRERGRPFGSTVATLQYTACCARFMNSVSMSSK